MATGEELVLGLDIGTNSVGWAVLKCSAPARGLTPEPVGLVDAGVRIFTEGVDRNTQGLEVSKSAARRAARSARRIHKRRCRRKKDLKSALTEAGLLPPDEKDLSTLMGKDPYFLRAAGLCEMMAPYDIGRSVFHLAQRRGFKSNRKSDRKKDDGKIAIEISGLAGDMEKAGCRTLGEYLFSLKNTDERKRLRNRHLSRGMVEMEFQSIWNEQKKHYPSLLTDEAFEKTYRAIFYQRPFDIRERWGKDLAGLPPGANARRAPELGRCEYEKWERRSPKATWYAQRFRMLQDVNNLEAIDTGTGESIKLAPEERTALVAELGRRREFKFDQLRKFLGLGESFKFNLEEGGRKHLKGNSTELNLRQCFKGAAYDALKPELRDRIIRAVMESESFDDIKTQGIEQWGLDEKGAQRLANTDLESGHLHLSVKALKKLLPYLEDGMTYMEAVEAAGYLRRDQRDVDTGKTLAFKDMPGMTNPLVKAALHQVRKVINSVAREYGTPDKIRVEMARELKSTREKREEIIKEQRENEKRNRDAVERLQQDFGIASPKGEDILRYKLWLECGQECPYTGDRIPMKALFSQDIEVDHIIPYSRSLDDSYMNKTLCYSSENRLKLDRTPWEYWGGDEIRWNEILKRASRLPSKKRDRFYMKEVPEDFISRQLNDTAYISKEVRGLLEKVAGKNNVQVGNGRATATLRRLWGLNTILGSDGEKNRADHRHHCVDAVVTALTSPAVLRKLSGAAAKNRKVRAKDFPLPWQGFRDSVKTRVDSIVVSHRAKKKVSGALHEETNYGKLAKDNGKMPLYAIRKSLETLSVNEVSLIADPRVREVVIGHLKANGVVDLDDADEKSAEWKKAMKDPANLPCLPNRNGPPVPIKKVRLHRPMSGMIDLGYRAVAPGNNHHIVIFEYADGKKKGQWDGNVVTMFEAVRRIKDKEPVIKKDLGEGKKFVMSLSIGEMVRVGDKEPARHYRVQKMNAESKQITFRLHTASTLDNNEERLLKYPSSLQKEGCVKVTVDPIGRVREAHD